MSGEVLTGTVYPADTQDAALTALALGRPSAEVAALCGMSAKRVRGWASEHRAEIAERRAEITDGAYGRILSAAGGAAELMHRAVTEEDMAPGDRLTLARTAALVVDTLLRLRGSVDHEARLTELEEHVKGAAT